MASIAGQHAASEIQSALLNERNIRRKSLKSELTESAIRNMLDYKPFVDGKTIQQRFGDLEHTISSRIFQSVQKGTIADYLKSQSVSFQREWLGKTRFASDQSGRLTLDQMVRPDS